MVPLLLESLAKIPELGEARSLTGGLRTLSSVIGANPASVARHRYRDISCAAISSITETKADRIPGSEAE
jgi:hypothetical protein